MKHVALEKDNKTFFVTGIVYFKNVVELRQQGEKAISEATDDVHIDFSKVQKMDSSIASLLCCWRRHANKAQKTLYFEQPSKSLLNLLNLYGLENMLFANSD